MGTVFDGLATSAIDDSGIDHLGCMYKVFDNYTPYIKVPPSTRVGCATDAQYQRISEYSGNFIETMWVYSYAGERVITTKAATRAIRMPMKNGNIAKAYVVDKTTGEYYFNGAEYEG